MGHGPCAFKEADVTRAIKAARKAGLEVARVEVENGKIVIVAGKPEISTYSSDDAQTEWDKKYGHH